MSRPDASASASSSDLPIPTLKILLIGSSSVGKSSLLLRFTEDEFLPPEEATATIGVDYKLKSIRLKDGRRFKLSIWDTAGQERYRTLTSSFYRGAQGILVVYDVTSRQSFESLHEWWKELETFVGGSKDGDGSGGAGGSQVVKCVVGNKVDRELARVVSAEEGKAFADDKGALFVEASAKEGTGVQDAFDEIVDRVSARLSVWAVCHAFGRLDIEL